MKKITYLLSLLALITIVSCTDTNLYSPPVPAAVTPVDYILEHNIDFSQDSTTTVSNDAITYKYDAATGILEIDNTFVTDSRSSMKGVSKVVNLGKSIEVSYTDMSPSSFGSIGTTKNSSHRHLFNVLQKGSTGKSILVTFNYDYPVANRNPKKTAETRTISL